MTVIIDYLMVRRLKTIFGLKNNFKTKDVLTVENKMIKKPTSKTEAKLARKMSVIGTNQRKSVRVSVMVLDSGIAPKPLIYEPIHQKNTLNEILALNEISRLQKVVKESQQ